MTNIVEQHIDKEVIESKTEAFDKEDLKEFTDLIEDKDNFDVLVKWFESAQVIEKIKEIDGLKQTLEAFVKIKIDLAGVFDKTYEEAIADDKDLYEVCVLGAILTKGKVVTPDYQALAKEYYLSIKTSKIESKETTNENIINGKFNSGFADIDTKTQTTIETKTELTKEKNITTASVTISAGADIDKMNNVKAIEMRDAKIKELSDLAAKFDEINKTEINKIVEELKSDKVKEISKDKATNQDGNRYLIATRIAEGFVEVLSKLVLTPPVKLTLTIDWKSCVIGNTSAAENERFVNINLEVKAETNTTGITQTNILPSTVITTNTNNTSPTTSGNITNPSASGNIVSSRTPSGVTTTADNTTVTIIPDPKAKWPNQGNETIVVTKTDIKNTTTESKEKASESTESPDIFIAERIRIALSKDFTRNGKAIDKDKDIKKIKTTTDANKFYVTIDEKDILFSFPKIDKDWNFDKDENGNVKIKETDKKYYEAKLETTEVKDKFKVYDVKETGKNITTTLNEAQTKEAFKTYYTFKEKGYTIDANKITITKGATWDLENIKTNIIFKLPKTILELQDKTSTTTEDVLENVTFDKNGEIKSWSGNTYEKFVGKNQVNLLTKDKDANDNYKKEKKNLNYNIKLSGKNINIINDEVKIDATTKLAEWNDNRMASEVENAEKTQETFKEYAADLDTNFSKRQINAKGGNEYELLVIPNISDVDKNEYITIPFIYKQKVNTQTQYFTFDKKALVVPEKYNDKTNEKYYVIDNLYYKIDIPNGEQTSINPRITLDYNKTKTEAINKTNTKADQMKLAATEKTDNNLGGRQDRNIALLNKITYNSTNYLDFSLDESNKTISYTREISLDEILGYDQTNKNKLILGTIKFNGNGNIIETTDRDLTVNKENQTLEIKNIFGRNKTLTIPFEIKDKKFVIGSNSNEKAKYIVEEFTKQKEALQSRIYIEKSTITTILNKKIKEMGTQRASEFPGLALFVPKEGLRKQNNTPTINALQYLKGPTSTGLYYLELNNAYKKGNDSRDAEYLYFKVSGKKVTLTDMNGNTVEETYIQSNKEYKPGKGLLQVKNDFSINTIKDATEQEKGYPSFEDEPKTLRSYLAKTVADADVTNYTTETSGKYLRIFGSSKIGHIASIPIKSEENNKNKYLYNQEGLKTTTPEDMAKDLRDYDNFKNLTNLEWLKESELKEIFTAKFIANKNTAKATEGDNIRIKNEQGKYEYIKISSKDETTIKFDENKLSKEIQEKVVDDIKKDLIILGAIENIKFKYRRSDEKKKTATDRNKAGNWTVKDLKKEKIKEFINKETVEEKKLILQLLGPAKETMTLDINDKVYQKLTAKDIPANGYYKNLFDSKLGDGADKEATVLNEKYKVNLQSNDEKKEYQVIFESQVEWANQNTSETVPLVNNRWGEAKTTEETNSNTSETKPTEKKITNKPPETELLIPQENVDITTESMIKSINWFRRQIKLKREITLRENNKAEEYQFDYDHSTSTDGQRIYYSIKKADKPVLDIGIFITWEKKNTHYIGVGEYIHATSTLETELNSVDIGEYLDKIIDEVGKNAQQRLA